MKNHLTRSWKIIIIFGTLFLTICLLLLLIFNAGKKSYTVTFDLDGGILLSGSLEQQVTQGQDATPPSAAKDGAYLRGWSGSYKKVTRDIVVTAIWEYETTPGIIYAESENQNFTEIVGSHPYLAGEVYLGAYYDNKKILGIGARAFKGRTGITKVYLLNGIISIGNSAFADCTSLTEIEIPETVKYLEHYAFAGCESLETVVLNEGLMEIKEGAFAGCKNLKEITIPATVTRIAADAFAGCESLETVVLNEGLVEIKAGAFQGCAGLTEVIIPTTVTHIEMGAFAGCEELVIKVACSADDLPDGWAEGCFGDAEIEWDFILEDETDESQDTDGGE